MSGLPKGWVEARLGEVTTKIGSGATPTGGEQSYEASGIPLIRSLNVHFDGVRAEGLAFLNEPQAAKLNNVVVEADDVLLNITGASIGRVAIAPSEYEGARVNQHVSIIRLVQEVLSEYVRSFLASPAAQDVITRENYGATRQALTKSMIEDFAFPLPPLAEQKRIVAKLDALNAKSARARTELARIETLVSRYKQALLNKAFSGELTREWSVRNVKASKWRPSLIAYECDIRLGKMLDKAKNKGEPTRYLRNINVRWGSFDLSDVLSMNMTSDERTKLDIRDGDVLLCEGGEPGRCAVWNLGPTDISFQKALMRVRPRPGLVSHFFFYFMRWAADENLLAQHFTGTTIKHLPQVALSKVPIPVPPLEEQHEIVRRIESAFAKIDRLANEAKRALELVGRLDEAILAKAFRGELVPQDENDEPAEHLLARIRAEREAAPKGKRGRGRASTAEKTTWNRSASAMNKSRKDVAPNHLSILLKSIGGRKPASELWLQSEMDIDEFYKQLRAEMDSGQITEGPEKGELVLANEN